MKKEFVIRGQTASGETEILEFGGYKEGYGYRMTEFTLYPADAIGSNSFEFVGSITAGKTAIAPTDVSFNDEGLIGSTFVSKHSLENYPVGVLTVINDTFLITQNLILMVQVTNGVSQTINWQCRFESMKLTDAQQAVTNYKQYSIFDE